jgi:FKBP-type peptidyl-prolyl cis-trans isomerase (trigger factor)
LLLPEVIDKNAREIKLKFSLDDLNDELIEKLENSAKTKKGTCKLTFAVYDNYEKLNLSFNAANIKVDAQEFLRIIENMPELTYQLN